MSRMHAVGGMALLWMVACEPKPATGGAGTADTPTVATAGTAGTAGADADADAPAAPSATAAGTATAETKTVVYQVSTMDGQVLGTITLPPGEVGTLKLTTTGQDADRLQELWAGVEKTKTATAKMHKPAPSGGRGGLASVAYRVGEPGYVDGVQSMLMSRYFEVAVVTP